MDFRKSVFVVRCLRPQKQRSQIVEKAPTSLLLGGGLLLGGSLLLRRGLLLGRGLLFGSLQSTSASVVHRFGLVGE